MSSAVVLASAAVAVSAESAASAAVGQGRRSLENACTLHVYMYLSLLLKSAGTLRVETSLN